jgi:carbon storage regulator CsrA
MLVLTRKVGEKIAIGQQREILITIVGISGSRIRVGIEADASITVRRVTSELATVQQEQRLPREI